MAERKIPKVTVHEDGAPPPPRQASASADLIAAAAGEVTVKGAGHTFTLRKPGILAQVNLIKVLGPEHAKNDALREIYGPLLYLKAIDGEPVIQPQNMMQLDALLAQVDEAGIVTIMEGVVEHYGPRDGVDHRDAVKN